MEPPAGNAETQPPASPDLKRWAVPAVIIVAAAIMASAVLPGLLAAPPPGETLPISTSDAGTTVPGPVHGTPGTTIPAPEEQILPGNETAVPTPTWSGPPSFTITISPARATAARGETIIYTLKIEAQNGFSDEIHMQIVASVLFFSQTQDLGIQAPPYPKTIEYPFRVPDTLFPGTTVNGVLTATGGGITREDHLTLTVK